MPVLPGTQLGPYQILSAIGAGGMGEVYKARDTRLGRDVAIKVLPDTWANDADRRARFEREAKTVSSLNHPHICTLYDIGSQDGAHFLVMELIEGETLAQRLTRGPLPLDQALRGGAQIADALDKAHRQGVVHRDLKPGNVMLAKSGVKLLDFGLAKQTAVTGATESTITLTSEGELVGTIPYMAPEQLEGKPVDARTDIFAFGALLYEALTGKRAFPGDSRASVIALIMNQEPPRITVLQPSIPPGIERLVAKCLAKDPEQRWQSATDLRDELLWLREAPQTAAAAAQPKKPWLWIALASTFAILAVASWLLPQRGDEVAAAHLSIVAPDGSEMSDSGSAISPDGKTVAFVAVTENRRNLWVRSLDSAKPRKLEGTDNAVFPFWSPDGGSIAFFSYDKLKRIDLAAQNVRVIASAAFGRGGTWSRTGEIVFAPALSSSLLRVSANGGEATPATIFNQARLDTRHNFPQFLPGGKRFLVFVRSSDPERTGTYVGTVGDPNHLEPVTGLKGVASQAVFAPSAGGSSGFLLFVRDRVLYAQPFEPKSARLSGSPSPIVLRDVYASAITPGFLNISVSETGTLLDGGSQRARNQLAWRNREGTLLEIAAPVDEYVTPKLSPDGTRVAVARMDPVAADLSIWAIDLARQASSRLTSTRGLNFYPIWSPDSRRMAFSSEATGMARIFLLSIGGVREASLLRRDGGRNQFPFGWSMSGKHLIYVETDPQRGGTRGDIWICPVDQPDAAVAYLSTPAGEMHPSFSPDAGDPRWVLYTSDETGIEEIYVRPFRLGPAPGTKWQISQAGGSFGRWSADGNEIFFLAPDGKMMAARIRAGESAIEIAAPQPLFDARLPNNVWLRYEYDVSPDGQRFLLLHSPEQRPGSAINVLLNWEKLIGR